MPRMWMVEPREMCDKHLIAEHHECHVFAGRIKMRMSIRGYLDNNLLEPMSIMSRHDALADEMTRRGFNHNSMLILMPEEFLSEDQLYVGIDKAAAKAELYRRCPACASVADGGAR